MSDLREFSFFDWLKIFLKALPAFLVVYAIVAIPLFLAFVVFVDLHSIPKPHPNEMPMQLHLEPNPRAAGHP